MKYHYLFKGEEPMIVNGDTICLLQECNSGSKMATDSIEQVMRFVETSEMKQLLEKYNSEHIKLGEDITEALKEGGQDEKDPSTIAKMSAWIQTEAKMTLDHDEKHIASLLIDGCNMGVKSLNEYRNKYTGASPKAVDYCGRLCRLEKNMSEDLERFL